MRDPDWDYHCTDLAVDHIKATTGRDIWKELGGAPRNARQASDILKKMHVRTLKNAVVKMLGKPVDPKLAMRGDIVMVDNALGICRGDLVECLDHMQPIGRAEYAWPLSRSASPPQSSLARSSGRKASSSKQKKSGSTGRSRTTKG